MRTLACDHGNGPVSLAFTHFISKGRSTRLNTILNVYNRSYMCIVLDAISMFAPGVFDNLRYAIHTYCPGTKVKEKIGRPRSFEIFIDGKMVYSKRRTGFYPVEEEVVHAVQMASKGEKVLLVNPADSCACQLL
ncbi:hypothetical protein ACJMK2_026648 [Sinanodonta woodiana]|uniref:Uncharacterized protein n=1 Tax=Sinanodonta woodiana TaxID=1069815 RepID=A0ABD3XMK3_SINWO